jgi:hypothetical protein
MANLLGPQTDDDYVDASFQSRRKIDSRAARAEANLIGGISADDRWKTTTQEQNNGEEYGDRKVNRKKRFDGDSDFVSPITGEPIADYGSWRDDNKQQQLKEQRALAEKRANATNQPNEQVKIILARLKKQLASHGASGIIGLGRKFRILDDDGSKSLSLSEFKKGMDEMKMNIAPSELQELFKYFGKIISFQITSYFNNAIVDIRKTGSISYDDFIETIAVSLIRVIACLLSVT